MTQEQVSETLFRQEAAGLYQQSCHTPDTNEATHFFQYRGNDIAEWYRIGGEWFKFSRPFNGGGGWTKFVTLSEP